MKHGTARSVALTGDEVFVTTNDSFSDFLSKREYFAAMAMQGMFANELLSGSEENAAIAADAVLAADALIAELNKVEK